MKLTATSLNGRLHRASDAEPIVVRLTADKGSFPRKNQAFIIQSDREEIPQGFDAYVILQGGAAFPPKSRYEGLPVYHLGENLSHLEEGDVIRINPRGGEVLVMYRRRSSSNSLLLTERCNSRCIMCSQPPKKAKDPELVEACLEAIPLIDPDTQEIGLTGGEPTLIGEAFYDILRACKTHLPATAIHVLSNGRLFNYLSYAQKLAEIDHPDCVIGIPIYSDLAWEHDFCVQAAGAYDQTIRGILNLARCGIRIEIRVVIHAYSVKRLRRLADFLVRNLPFTEHVALMGLEPIGFGKTNIDALWIDPLDYREELEAAVDRLVDNGMNVSIYNHQLCVLPTSLWSFARQSISDWKNIYIPPCGDCVVRESCGGFFHSAVERYSRGIKPLTTTPDDLILNEQEHFLKPVEG